MYHYGFAFIFLLPPLCLTLTEKVHHFNADKTKDAKERFRKLLKDAVFKEHFSSRLKKSSQSESSELTQHDLMFLKDNDFNTINNERSVVKNDVKHVLVMTLALSLEDFLLKESRFLQDIESHIKNKYVKCQVAEASLLSASRILVDIFCYYGLLASSNNMISATIFVPTHKLERLMTSGEMRGFLQKYNVTKFFKKENENKMFITSASSITQDIWFPIALGLGGTIFIILLIVLLLMCCKRRNRFIEEGEKSLTTEQKPSTTEQKPSYSISPIKCSGRNSFSKSPNKPFSYSPHKNSTPMFSFTSPTKYMDKVIYPIKSPIETTPPFLVQPQLDLLYPTTPASPSKSQMWSSNSSAYSDRHKNLLQSRRGSSASLIIDISPQSPVYHYIAHESPTEEILIRKSRSIRYRELQRIKDNNKELHEEFWSIPPNTVSRKETQMRFSLKNRYPDIIPNARSMVRLKGEDSDSQIYVNANFIRGYNGTPNQYIATQGPLACTLSDFWLMIWQFNVSIIVMITRLKEQNKEKCTQYWPSPDTTMQQNYGDITVTYDSEINRDGYKILTLYASHKGSAESRKITHFWFTAWPDHKVPKTCNQVVSLLKDVRQVQATQCGPVVIHCSAGRGRTGCFIALSLGMSQIDDENEIDILNIVSQMRIDRGGMVDKDHQYVFLYHALYEYWTNKRRSSIASPSFSRHSVEEAHEEIDSADSLDGDYSSYTAENNYKFQGFSFAE